ncbi:5,10-methylenetetrahydrofolate reductase [Pseudokineococcus lusitanus]|uniref:5,10-methylenetetrahydrofolate reductase n=1 Tax=Pseudokineococcus lusitanus TaxID=763993 RepID=A0A3N1GAK5_9ACTN|nr:5,10-methylenetetrahydrofolate reductase [Pseudokineococcus lusitanus]ROP27273.1 5,10-methylenetetrahydrofolate reductase [Pseudokineococcus lusitanus]
MDLVEALRRGDGGFLLFGLTPPKASASGEDVARIADLTLERLRTADPDGVVLYDITDEGDRNDVERPFPFLPTVDPAQFLADHLRGWDKPAVVYRSVGKYPEAELRRWMRDQPADRVVSTLVGAASSASVGLTSLARAYDVQREEHPGLLAGGVVIPERHTNRGDEHVRMLDKQARGCAFFVSQVLYDANAAKTLVSDYRDGCDARGVAPRPLVFTVSVCGSTRTLDFLTWLGVQVPRWVRGDLLRAQDTLVASTEHAAAVAADVVAYCRRLDVPVGLAVESVSSRRTEIEAAVDLAADLRALLDG